MDTRQDHFMRDIRRQRFRELAGIGIGGKGLGVKFANGGQLAGIGPICLAYTAHR
jgi:hypothetical protein